MERHTNRVINVCFSHDSKRLAVAAGGGDFNYTQEGEIRVWEIEDSEPEPILKTTAFLKLQRRGVSVAFSRDDSRLFIGLNGKVLIWDPWNDRVTRTMAVRGTVSSVAFTPDGSRLVAGTQGKDVYVWNFRAGSEPRTLQADSNNVFDVELSNDGKQLITSGKDRSIKFWDRSTGKLTKQLRGQSGSVLDIALSPDGRRLVSTARSDDSSVTDNGCILVWDTRKEMALFELKGHTRFSSTVAFSPDGMFIASGSWDGATKLWDARTGEQVNHWLSEHPILSVQFSANGQQVAAGDAMGKAVLFDVKPSDPKSGQPRLTLLGHTGAIRSIAFSPNGRSLATASSDRSIKLWDAKTGKELRTLKGHLAHIDCVAFSPDGTRLISGGGYQDCLIKLWDTATGSEVLTLSGHSNGITGVLLSPDGETLISSSRDGTVKLWDGSR